MNAHALSECARWHFAVHREEHPADAPAGHVSLSSLCVHTAGLHQICAYSKMPYSIFLYILQNSVLFFPALLSYN